MSERLNLKNAQRPVLVTGASGFLGETLLHRLVDRGVAAVGTYLAHPVSVPRADTIPVDLEDDRAVHRLVRDLRPSAIFHTAAQTDAGFCEREPDRARAAILDATVHLGAAVSELAPGTPVVGFSTDLVFDGRDAPYAPGDWAKPLSVYGSLKYMAEAAVLALRNGVVVRSALMFGPPTRWRQGFLGWMRESLAEGKTLNLFEDEVRTPVSTGDLSDGALGLVESGRTGLYHAGGPERLTRLEMGQQLCRLMGVGEELLRSVRLSDFDGKPPRPADVSLESGAFWRDSGVTPTTFLKGVRNILECETPSEKLPS